MARIIAQLITWLAGKMVIYLVILALLLGIFVIKVVPPMVVRYHEKELEKAIAELSESRALVGELAERAKGMGEEIDRRTQELRELDEKRKAMEEWLEKVMNLFRKDEIEAEKRRIDAKEKRLLGEISALAQDKRQLRIEGGESEEELKRRELLRDEKEKQLGEIKGMRAALDSLMRNQFRQLALNALMILAALILIPFLWKLLAYYVIAPLAQSSAPILLGSDVPGSGEITATPSHPAQRISLAENEVMMTKVDYLQGSMGNFEKKTKWLMDWHYPLSSIAAGLYVLTQIRNIGAEPGQITLSTQENATEELAVVSIPEGKSMVFRPHYLVAVSHPLGQPPRIRSKWVFRKLHSWVNLRFRYLMVDGPAKLVFSAQRGVQVEDVSPDLPGRRVNSHLTAAFSPHLNYSPRRAETFVAYIRGKNALFDDFFQGSGQVIQQQVSGGRRNPAARLWEGVFGAIGKVFGI
ncbi:hypothetical protein HZ994_15505 [Akkermansiaceae bacterium]|nr:hypothetical protein HZ994_15505 [Akkermansiaceae bacterium]